VLNASHAASKTILTSWVDVVALRASLNASQGNLGAFLFSRFDVSPYAIVLPLGNLIQASKPTKSLVSRKTYHGATSTFIIESIADNLGFDLRDQKLKKLFVNRVLYVNARTRCTVLT